jgi:hypothetical protein
MKTSPTSDPTSSPRSRRLRHQASSVHPVLAQAYRRRAAELELAAWVRTVVSAPGPVDELALAG